ncbi:hypothetical protein FNV43_RR19720 [Rhamnella rubrinervis]|uniref:Uncharacterized protein n=1 Tax=Rhamnella rubrinervis TaxID=2594499 RepID=A0A8K0DT65_9ROSA|nr:hypothetical protein FNV43_RR19720 [Rhamnella rubrinervis]
MELETNFILPNIKHLGNSTEVSGKSTGKIKVVCCYDGRQWHFGNSQGSHSSTASDSSSMEMDTKFILSNIKQLGNSTEVSGKSTGKIKVMCCYGTREISITGEKLVRSRGEMTLIYPRNNGISSKIWSRY